MRNLAHPAFDELTILDDAIQSLEDRDRLKLAELRTTLSGAYAKYSTLAPHLERHKAIRLRKRHVSTVSRLWNAVAGTGSALRATLLKLGNGTCPYCSMGQAAIHLDHYLGRAEYPEFILLPANLVPSCARCNSPRKSVKHGRRRLLHFYFDPVDSIQRVLRARIHFESSRPIMTFILKMPPKPSAVTSLYAEHCRTLKLLHAYNMHFTDYRLPTIVDDVKAFGRYGADEVVAVFRKRAAARAARDGENDPEVAAFYAVAESRPFVEWAVAQ
ncbi:MAG: hypothetical protein JNL79_04120 [Myxococcales bacterium]|nr:hypothetical protein [Myxococcales bacterium]